MKDLLFNKIGPKITCQDRNLITNTHETFYVPQKSHFLSASCGSYKIISQQSFYRELIFYKLISWSFSSKGLENLLRVTEFTSIFRAS